MRTVEETHSTQATFECFIQQITIAFIESNLEKPNNKIKFVGKLTQFVASTQADRLLNA